MCSRHRPPKIGPHHNTHNKQLEERWRQLLPKNDIKHGDHQIDGIAGGHGQHQHPDPSVARILVAAGFVDGELAGGVQEGALAEQSGGEDGEADEQVGEQAEGLEAEALGAGVALLPLLLLDHPHSLPLVEED